MNRLQALMRGSLLVLLLVVVATPTLADELDPRRWTHLPINTNFIGTAYAHTNADIALDPVLKLENVKLKMHSFGAKYIRTFALFDKTARFDVLQVYQEGRWNGLLDGAPATAKRRGWADTLIRFAVNLYGSPALQGKEYADYRAAQAVETIVGVGMSVQLPTGDYMDDKLINLGSNRYTFRPQLGVIHSRGNWSSETTGIVSIFTDNSAFFNGKKLEQEPLYIVQSHLIYNIRPGVWAGISGGYDYGGRSTINGVRKDDRKQDVALALGFGFPLHRHLGVKLAYVGYRTLENTGVDSRTFALSLAAFW